MRKFRIFSGFTVLLPFIFAAPLWTSAETVQESEQALSQAQNNYFNTVMQSGSMSAQQRAQLYNQTVAPAQTKLSESISHTWSDTVNSRLQASSNVDSSKSPASQMLAKKQKQLSGLARPGAESNNASEEPQVSNSSQGNIQAPHSRRGETVLSGAGIKPILEFPGRRPSPSPIPNP